MSIELGVDPEDPLGSVTPCSFKQLRYAAKAELLAALPPNPPNPPFGSTLAQALDAAANFELLANPPPAGGLPDPVGGAPPGVPPAPEGGLPPEKLGSVTPCLDRHCRNAESDAPPDAFPLDVVVVVVAELPPHAVSSRPKVPKARMTFKYLNVRILGRSEAGSMIMTGHDDTPVCETCPGNLRVS